MNLRKSLFAVALTALAGSALAAHAGHRAGRTGQDHGQPSTSTPGEEDRQPQQGRRRKSDRPAKKN